MERRLAEPAAGVLDEVFDQAAGTSSTRERSGGRRVGQTASRLMCDALAGPLPRPPLPQTMDAVVKHLFTGSAVARAGT